MNISEYKFKNGNILLNGGKRKSVGVSKSSIILSDIIPPLGNKDVMDIGCGIGYMSVGALSLGARKIVALDLSNMKYILQKNTEVNGYKKDQIAFIKSDLFAKVPEMKVDVIIANLPQHALPATPSAKKLQGKYGGYDGTDIICRAITEGAYFLKPGGKYYGAVSRLTNFNRTLNVAKTMYKVNIIKTVLKTMEKSEMLPYINETDLYDHIKKLKNARLIEYNNKNGLIEYKVHLCEFILK